MYSRTHTLNEWMKLMIENGGFYGRHYSLVGMECLIPTLLFLRILVNENGDSRVDNIHE